MASKGTEEVTDTQARTQAEKVVAELKDPGGAAERPLHQVSPRRRLRFRMATGVALGLVAIFAIFAILMSWGIRTSTEAALQERVWLSQHTAEMVDDLISHARFQLESAAAQVPWGPDASTPATTQQALQVIAHTMGTFSNLGVTDQRGTPRWFWGLEGEVEKWSSSAVVKQALAEGRSSVGQIQGSGSHPPIALVAVPLRDGAGQVAGALGGTLHLVHLGKPLVPLPSGGAELRVEVVSPLGRILASSDGEVEGYPVSKDHWDLLKEVVAQGQKGSAIHEMAGGQGHVVAYAPFRTLPGGVFVEERRDIALAVPRNLQRIGLFMGSAALLLCSLGAWWLANRLTRPLEELAEASRAIASGSFDRPVRWQGQDELGLLAESFEDMRLRLKVSLEQRQLWEQELERRVQESTREVHQLLGKVITAQEDERKRVARELHDGAAQNLATLLVALETLDGSKPGQEQPEMKLLRRVEEEARDALQEVRRLILDLRPAALDDLGLVPALRWYGESRLGPSGTAFTLEVQGREARLTAPVETVLFRILQEAMNNIAKHAEARRALLRLEFLEDRVSATVEDDGRGFDLEAADSKGGVGLAGMRERASLVGGALTISSRPEQGTQISVSIPLGELHA